MDAKQEEAWENRDRCWRRWEHFVRGFGEHDPYLGSISSDGRRLLSKCFIIRYRDGKFDVEGRYAGKRKKPMVASTIRDAISNVAAAFRSNDRPSPFHYHGGASSSDRLRKEVKELLSAFENRDPPPNRQKAVSPQLLRDMLELSGKLTPLHEHTADLAVGGFFFAMRACEFCRTERERRTQRLTLGDITFRDRKKRVVPKTAADLGERAEYVTVRFVFQKNQVKSDRRTQSRSGRDLCPVRSWVKICQRVIGSLKKPGNETEVCQIGDGKGRSARVTSD